jgi:hypothetical protein
MISLSIVKMCDFVFLFFGLHYRELGADVASLRRTLPAELKGGAVLKKIVITHNQTSQPKDFDYCFQLLGGTRTRLISAAS